MNPPPEKHESLKHLNNTCLEAVTFEGKPYFLYEDKPGLFYAVKSILPTEDRRGHAIFNDEIGELVLGQNLMEVRCEGTLKVEVLRGEFLPYLVDGLKRFASRVGEDYFSYKTVNGNGLLKLHPTDKPQVAVAELFPRIFVRRF